jgi:hypothetical protein
MQSYCKGMFPKWILLNKACIAKNVFGNEFQNIVFKVFSLILKGLF